MLDFCPEGAPRLTFRATITATALAALVAALPALGRRCPSGCGLVITAPPRPVFSSVGAGARAAGMGGTSGATITAPASASSVPTSTGSPAGSLPLRAER